MIENSGIGAANPLKRKIFRYSLSSNDTRFYRTVMIFVA
jgi:hypothetical protein